MEEIIYSDVRSYVHYLLRIPKVFPRVDGAGNRCGVELGVIRGTMVGG